MRVADSAIFAGATHSSLNATETRESLRLWIGEPQGAPPAPVDDRVSLSEEGSRRHRSPAGSRLSCAPEKLDTESALSPHLLLAKLIIEEFTGTSIDLSGIDSLDEDPPEIELPKADAPAGGRDAAQSDGWGIAYDRTDTARQEESLAFDLRGTVLTTDGRQFAFSLDFELNRTYVEQNSLRFRAGDAARIDPLVINFGRPAAELTPGRFSFDLDADGREESLSTPAAGSGFLALDRNGDGVINDGRELFGPSTGEGFSELARLDKDGSGWIDDNDDAFDRLRIWTRDGGGNETFQTLRQQGVGAIYLTALGSAFDYRDGANSLQGSLRQTGIFLRESGSAGSIQQIDFTA